MKMKLFALALAASLTAMLPSAAAAENSSLSVGDYVTAGSYNGQKLVWRYVGDDDNGHLMVCKDVICFKAFAPTDLQSEIRNRQSYGNNRWAASSIRIWLNSSERKVDYGNAAPTASMVWMNTNAYDSEAGFLTGFSSDEKAAVKEVKLRTVLNDVDKSLADGTYKTVVFDGDCNKTNEERSFQTTSDKIFLLDEAQIDQVRTSLSDNFCCEADSVIDYGAYKNSDTTNADGFMLRSPNTYEKANDMVNHILSDSGSPVLSFSPAYMAMGVRPAFYLTDGVTFASGSGSKTDPYVISANTVTTEKAATVSNVTVVSEGGTLKLYADNKELQSSDAAAFIDDNGRTMVPVRMLSEGLGYGVNYDDKDKSVTVTDSTKTVNLKIGSTALTVDGKTVEMDTSAVIINDRTYVPLRFIAEALGSTVEYQQAVTGWSMDENGNITPTFTQ